MFDTLPPKPGFRRSRDHLDNRDVTVLAVLWSLDEPRRAGEIVPIPPERGLSILGRGQPQTRDVLERLQLYRQRPGLLEPTGPLLSPSISREQLHLELRPSGRLSATNVGRCPMLVNGVELEQAELGFGDLLELQDQLIFLCLRRPEQIPAMPEVPMHGFGEVDAWGLVGESPACWELRQQLVFVARRNAHVLVRGASGTGKELIARAIHALSSRAGRPMVSRNAATFPESLIDAELFGNAKNYPNPGMADRPGLVGEAHGSTLFLDEFGELPAELQAHLLRVMDQGEYQRLGESTLRRADFRLVAATNRPEADLKHDVLARLKLRVMLPDLNARREDIPLIARHLLRRIASEDRQIADRYFDGGPSGEPRLAPALVSFLVRHTYTTHVRELEALLWRAIARSREDYIDLSADMVRAAERAAAAVVAGLARESGGEGPSGTAERRSDPGTTTALEEGMNRRASGAPQPTRAPASVMGATSGTGRSDASAGTGTGGSSGGAGPSVQAVFRPEHGSAGAAAESAAASGAGRQPDPAVLDPGAAAWEASLEPQEQVLLSLYRRHRFNVTSCSRDPACPVERATADVYLRVMMFKALNHAGWDLPVAAGLVVGGEDVWLQGQLLERLETTLQNLQQRLAEEGEEAFREKLARYYRASFPWIDAAIKALKAGALRVPPAH
jgi:two-component system nitrogen regulation response regulator GlnG/two-component system response regulator HydG